MAGTDLIVEKVQEVKSEMEQMGLWKKHPPLWVHEYQERSIATENDFSEWLQFVYLPNLVQQSGGSYSRGEKKQIVLQAMDFFGQDVTKGRLLQLLIELDALH